MRILVVHDRPSARGGAERYIRETTAALAERGHKVRFLSASDKPQDQLHGPSYFLMPSEGWRGGRRRRRDLYKILLTVRPSLVFVHNTKLFLSPVLLEALTEVAPSVLFVHDVNLFCPNETKIIRANGEPCRHPVGIACLRRGCYLSGSGSIIEELRSSAIVRWRLTVCRNVDILIAPSRYVADELVRNGIRRERITVLPHFTNRGLTTQVMEPTTDFLWVGGLYDCKGFKYFVEALGMLSDLPWRAIVVGDGDGMREARSLVDRSGLGARISFLGHLDDMELDNCYALARVIVITSVVAESFCLVGIEAMAHGRPVVAFDVGGICEWLQDASTGIAVPRGDIRAMAQAMRRLLTEPNLREQLGRSGREAVDAKFRSENHLAGLLSVMKGACMHWGQRREAQRSWSFYGSSSSVS